MFKRAVSGRTGKSARGHDQRAQLQRVCFIFNPTDFQVAIFQRAADDRLLVGYGRVSRSLVIAADDCRLVVRQESKEL